MSFIYRDANYTRTVHEKVLIYVHLVANRHFESSTMLLIFLFIITTLWFLITVLYLAYEEAFFQDNDSSFHFAFTTRGEPY